MTSDAVHDQSEGLALVILGVQTWMYARLASRKIQSRVNPG